MFIQANPDRGKTAEEKEELRTKYRPGDVVMPTIAGSESSDESGNERDRRMVEEIREMSLREVGVENNRTYERGIRHTNRSHDTRENGQRQRRRQRASGREDPVSTEIASSDSRSQARQVEHQSSLRSLISNSDVESVEVEEILRQIMDDGFLDGVDLNNLDVTQEDDLSERIAEAYRRRQGSNSNSERNRHSGRDRPRSSRNPHAQPTSFAEQPANSSHPPVSRPQLLEAYPTGGAHGRRTASESRRQTSPIPASNAVQQQAARSATDLSNRSRISVNSQSGSTAWSIPGGSTESRSRRVSDNAHSRPARPHSGNSAIAGNTPEQRPAHITNSSPTRRRATGSALADRRLNPAGSTSDGETASPKNRTERDLYQDSSTAPSVQSPSILYPEPSISCERCSKADIQYELHENCSQCKGGLYNLCHRCYLLGLGCLHWFGFGEAGLQRFNSLQPASQILPHTLTSRRYLRPRAETVQQASGDPTQRMTTEDPSHRFRTGVFCSNCLSFANECFWKCAACNDGVWGFCNSCVNSGRCCSHPLLPVAHITATDPKTNRLTPSIPSDAYVAPNASPSIDQEYLPLAFSTPCSICRYPISPSNTRFHCPQCPSTTATICTPCYLKLVATNRISPENGDKGWRRCLQGHRMIVIGFEDVPAGQRRVVVKDLVGGLALKDEAQGQQQEGQQQQQQQQEGALAINEEWSWRDGTERQKRTVSKAVAPSVHTHNTSTSTSTSHIPLLQKYPPDGGVGMRVLARWSYWPLEGGEGKDELGFPKGAEIREAEDINGDWYWGVYSGRKGLFPGNYTILLGVVEM
ncbi:hypothetical protein MMC09_005861 [Bachmanniomyces sp. S44760]|nr:hypothetical protein [Bachmanniomyces sp. S44760]